MKYSELYRLIERNGWVRVRTNKHHVYTHPDKPNDPPLIIGKHGSEEVKFGTLRNILKQMGLR
jgi:predicted RNA binding protein YcfA (HicA-like mRNA interferase family)